MLAAIFGGEFVLPSSAVHILYPDLGWIFLKMMNLHDGRGPVERDKISMNIMGC